MLPNGFYWVSRGRDFELEVAELIRLDGRAGWYFVGEAPGCDEANLPELRVIGPRLEPPFK
jgi:hypothetical protein